MSVCLAGFNRVSERVSERSSDRVSDRVLDLARQHRNVSLRRRQSVKLSPTKHAALHALVVANSCLVKDNRDMNKVCNFYLKGFLVSRHILIVIKVSNIKIPLRELILSR